MMPPGLLQQPIFIKSVGFADKTLEPVTVDGALKRALAYANEYLRRDRGGGRVLYPDDAQGVNAKRGPLLAKKLFDELLAAQVFLFREDIFSLSC